MFSFLIFIIVIAATFYVALMYLNASLFLVVYMEAALFIAAAVYLVVCRFTVKARIKIPVGISEPGKENLLKIHINNKSFLPLMRVKAYIVIHETIGKTKKHSKMKISEVASGKNDFIGDISFSDVGNYEVILKALRVYDLTGLLSIKIPVKKATNVIVMPPIYDMPVRLTMAVKNFFGESDIYDEYKSGHDNSELFKVREYQKGDRLQNVHWKMTAKHDELMVKEHSLPKACPVVFLLDYNAKNAAKKMVATYISAAVSISYSMMDAGCAHYVAWYDEKKNDFTRVRVDDEESLFYFMSIVMKVRWNADNKEQLSELYTQKYKAENYVWLLTLDEKLQLKKAGELQAQLVKKELKESLSKSELLL